MRLPLLAVIAIAVLVALAAPALASEPGQPLDCSDWVFVEPGYSCSELLQCSTSGGCPTPE